MSYAGSSGPRPLPYSVPNTDWDVLPQCLRSPIRTFASPIHFHRTACHFFLTLLVETVSNRTENAREGRAKGLHWGFGSSPFGRLVTPASPERPGPSAGAARSPPGLDKPCGTEYGRATRGDADGAVRRKPAG